MLAADDNFDDDDDDDDEEDVVYYEAPRPVHYAWRPLVPPAYHVPNRHQSRDRNRNHFQIRSPNRNRGPIRAATSVPSSQDNLAQLRRDNDNRAIDVLPALINVPVASQMDHVARWRSQVQYALTE